MCGISGVFSRDNKSELRSAIEAMNASQSLRGPDDDGVFVDDEAGVALGHRRLSIIDLSASGHQPFRYQGPKKGDRANDSWLTLNGEIYNFLELKKDLVRRGYSFRSKTDTEVVSALYAEYGPASFSRLRGMFAFALFDADAKTLFLVRDRYGIKPLYYSLSGSKLVFASTVKAIIASGFVSEEKDKNALIGFLLFGSVPLPRTTFKDVQAVPAGHYLVVDRVGNKKIVRYHDPFLAFTEKKDVSFEEAKKNIRSLLEESVNLHLISDAPLGVFLSVGLDSSVLSTLAAKNRERPITTLSVDFDEEEFSERKYQEIVAKKIASDHRRIKIKAADFSNSFDDIFEAMDQPSIDGVNTFFIAKAAKEIGLKVVLSGLGSDEIFCGYKSFRRIGLLAHFQNLIAYTGFPSKIPPFFGERLSKISYLKEGHPLGLYLSVRGLFLPADIASLLEITEGEVRAHIKTLTEEFREENTLHPVDFLSYMEILFYLQNQLLKDTDFMSMRHSVEVRVPYLDHALVEYVSSLNPRLKMGGSIGKPLLVESVRDIIPPEIVNRKKMGFTFPFEMWLRQAIEDPSSPIKERIQGGDRIPREIMDRFRSGKLHWSRFWTLIVLSRFYKKSA
ncbi:MAG: asparagine synthase (glutamine-hydrolyzing) [Patescibacteria group bacterium]